ncbi:P-loop containing nucleoside triphosphate hydrolase protein [Scenedesmus sp. NREL 46B-D3]|nr:P-loop containing nucleoside triphosphate hydrolase protein [Scenedesmus sp. NREL 46B-D3]
MLDKDVAIQIVSPSSKALAPAVPGAAEQAMPGYPTGMTLTIQGLSYSVLNNQNTKETLYLLKGVTGYFRPQEMAALMGPSGSGKTTLLDLLAGRKTVGSTQGSILFAGNKPTRQFLRKFTGYVEQFDTLLPILSVEEMMLYTAELKRPRTEPLADKKAAVAQLLEKLALTPCRHVKIGNPLEKGISGGQAKRVNIGISLITSPRVLFLDEPTSGLDSFTANEVMTTVKALVTDGVTMIATIHSPTAYSFSLFDSLMMLVRGRAVYFGKPGNAAVDYVRALHGAPGIALTQQQLDSSSAWAHNAAEWMVDVFTQADREGRGGAFADAYEASPLKQANDEEAVLLVQSHADLPLQVQRELGTRSETVTPWWWGLRTLIKYRTTNNYKSSAFLGARIGDKVLMGLLMMTLYLGIGDDFNPGNYINMAAVLFMWITMPAFGAAAYVPSLVLERNLYARERNDGLYRVFTYLAAKMFDELAINLVVSLPVVAVCFYGIRLQGSFVLFWLVYYVTLCVGIVLAYFVAALAPSMDVANAALPVYVTTLLFFGGFLFTFSTMPPWWKWYSFINPLRYSWTAVMLNQFEAIDPVWLGGQTVLEYYGVAGQSKVCAWATLSFKKYQTR